MRDIDIRRALLKKVKHAHRTEIDTTLIVEELGLCQGIARVDLAVVNGTVHGYEIKSDQDTLARLMGQRNVYNRALEWVTIIIAKNHDEAVRRIIPSWWGIWSAFPAKNGVRLCPSRESQPNPSVDPFALAQLLWRDEALEVLVERGLASSFLSKPREQLWRKLASELNITELGAAVRDRLKRRGANWRAPGLQA